MRLCCPAAVDGRLTLRLSGPAVAGNRLGTQARRAERTYRGGSPTLRATRGLAGKLVLALELGPTVLTGECNHGQAPTTAGFPAGSSTIASSAYPAKHTATNRIHRILGHMYLMIDQAVAYRPSRAGGAAASGKRASNRHVMRGSLRSQPAAFVVNLRRRDVAVAKQLLDGADVLAVCQEQRGGRGTG